VILARKYPNETHARAFALQDLAHRFSDRCFYTAMRHLYGDGWAWAVNGEASLASISCFGTVIERNNRKYAREAFQALRAIRRKAGIGG
jgi:hypothetical protein